MTRPQIDPDDPMFKPLTMREVMEITGRSRDTIERWVRERRLTPYEERNRRKITKIFDENQVVEVEHGTSRAARQGRPRPKRAPEAEGVDAGS